MSSKMAWLGSGLTLLAGLSLIYFARDISELITAPFLKPQATTSAKIGDIEEVKGPAYLKPKGGTREVRLTERLELQHLDQIRTENGAHVIVHFNSGWRVQLVEESTFIFESYRPDLNDSPLLMTQIRGDYQILNDGTNGRLFVGRDKKVFLPNNKPKTATPTVQISSSAATSDPQTATETVTSEEPLPAVAPTPSTVAKPTVSDAKKKGPLPDKLPAGHEETLSSSYIESVLAQEAATFRRCQMNSVRDNLPSIGTLLVSLTIINTGAVTGTRVLQNEMNNEPISQCVLSAISRLKFKEFDGLPITLTYPIDFK